MRGRPHLVLVALDEDLFAAWEQVVFDHPDVCEAVHGDIRTLHGMPVWVSPANSFGFMDGGIDGVFSEHFAGQGVDIGEIVRDAIGRLFGGELPVGEAVVVPTGGRPEQVIAAPTMRVPMALPADTVNPFLAMRAVLRCLDAHPDITAAVVPGLGTLTGRVPAEVCARQVSVAIDQWKAGWPMFVKWQDTISLNDRLLGRSWPVG